MDCWIDPHVYAREILGGRRRRENFPPDVLAETLDAMQRLFDVIPGRRARKRGDDLPLLSTANCRLPTEIRVFHDLRKVLRRHHPAGLRRLPPAPPRLRYRRGRDIRNRKSDERRSRQL